MGAALSAVASCLGSCAAALACGCVKNTCQTVGKRGSLQPYFLLLFVTTVLAFILRYWGGPIVINLTVTTLSLCTADSSLPCYGFGALTRLSFSLTLFFLLHLALPLLSRFQWWLKGCLLLVAVVGCWFIPDSFYLVYVDIARFFSGLFLLMQLIILVDAAYSWQEAWTSDERPWHKALLAVSTALFAFSIVLLVLMFRWFSEPQSDCRLETFFLSFTLVLTVLTSLLSVSPWIEGGGLLPAAVVTSYCMYLLFSALSSDPSQCNGLYGEGGSASSEHATIWQSAISIAITAASIGYAAYNIYTSSSLIGEGDDGAQAAAAEDYKAIAESKEDSATAAAPPAQDIETVAPASSSSSSSASDSHSDDAVASISNRQYRRFYLVMSVASMYLCMLLTNWGNQQTVDDPAQRDVGMGKQNMWIRIGSQWAVIALYVWSLIAPLVLSDRQF
jgi:hypothetical protein